MTVEELMRHIDGCFEIWITEKDKKNIAEATQITE